MLPASHRGVGPMVGGTHPSMREREREHSPRLCNNNPCNTHALLFLVYVKHILHGRVYAVTKLSRGSKSCILKLKQIWLKNYLVEKYNLSKFILCNLYMMVG